MNDLPQTPNFNKATGWSSVSSNSFLPCSAVLEKKKFECDVDPNSSRCKHLSDMYSMCLQRQNLVRNVSNMNSCIQNYKIIARPH
jgi:hypothetical protein